MRSQASLDSPFAKLGFWLADHPRGVIAVFVAALAFVGVYGSTAADHLSVGGFEVPGTESDMAASEAARRFGIASADVLVLYSDPGGDIRAPGSSSQILDVIDQISQVEGVISTTSYWDTNQNTFISRDGHETLVIVSLHETNMRKLRTFQAIEPMLREVEPPLQVAIGGYVATSVLAQGIAKRDIAKAEMIALPIALLLTLIFFRSVIAAMLPIVIGGFAVASCAALMRFGVKYTEIAVFALNISAFLGLGLAIDYALLMVQRFREELAGGATPREATAIMLDTAGRAVWVSGLAVVVSLSVLLGIPIPILRSIALGGVLAVITAFAGGMLVLPAVLAWLGPNVNRFSIGRSSAAAPPSPIWRKLGTLSMRHPIWVSVSCATALLAFASPVLRMRSAVPDTRMFAVQSEVRRVDTALGDANRFDPGGASAIQLVVSMEQGTPLDPDNLRRLRDYGARIRALDGVVNLRSAVRELDPDRMTPEEIESQKRREPTATELRRTVNENTILLVAGGKHPWRSIQAADVVEQVRAIPHPGLRVKVGGPSAQMLDLRATLSSYGRVAAVAVLAWSFLVLLVSFRSLFVPAKAVVMNILSLGASYGLLVWVFQDGHLSSVIGFEPLDAIDPTIPLVLFTIVFGLSMDYEVFLLSRIQEEWLRSGDNRESVIYGIANTGRIITSAALILVVVIGAFAAGDLVYVKQVGVGMTAAIVLDATLVRGLLVPATMQLMGHWNWWAPRWLQRKPTA